MFRPLHSQPSLPFIFTLNQVNFEGSRMRSPFPTTGYKFRSDWFPSQLWLISVSYLNVKGDSNRSFAITSLDLLVIVSCLFAIWIVDQIVSLTPSRKFVVLWQFAVFIICSFVSSLCLNNCVLFELLSILLLGNVAVVSFSFLPLSLHFSCLSSHRIWRV